MATVNEKIKLADYTKAKSDANGDIQLVGKTFTWQYSPTVNGLITTEPVEEIKRAFDLAYDNINHGCTAHNNGVCSSDYSDDTSDYHSDNEGNYSGDRSFCGCGSAWYAD